MKGEVYSIYSQRGGMGVKLFIRSEDWDSAAKNNVEPKPNQEVEIQVIPKN